MYLSYTVTLSSVLLTGNTKMLHFISRKQSPSMAELADPGGPREPVEPEGPEEPIVSYNWI